MSAGDLVALEASYHSLCITSLYKRAETVCKDQAADTKFQLEGIALAELITYIEEARESSDAITIFKLVLICIPHGWNNWVQIQRPLSIPRDYKSAFYPTFLSLKPTNKAVTFSLVSRKIFH